MDRGHRRDPDHTSMDDRQRRDRPNHYVEVVEFPSYAEAMKNNDLPQTKDFSQRIADLCDDMTFYNIDDVETFEP
jgi:hypothetical protein